MIIIISVAAKTITKVLSALVMGILWLSILFCRLYFHAHYFSDVIGGTSLANHLGSVIPNGIPILY